jgi:hypothetical protein
MTNAATKYEEQTVDAKISKVQNRNLFHSFGLVSQLVKLDEASYFQQVDV